MKILLECKRLMSYGGVGTEQYVDIGGKRVPRMLIRVFVIFMLLSLTIIHSINCHERYPLGLHAMLFSAHLFLLNNLKLAVYCVLLWKTDQIAQLIDYLRTMVERRRVYFSKSFSYLS